jgi:hypothetical protein
MQCDFSSRIFTILENTLRDAYSTPRAPCYITKQGALEVCLSGADRMFYYPDLEEIEYKFGTYKILPKNDWRFKPLLVKILKKLSAGQDTRLDAERRTDEVKGKYKLDEKAANKKVLTEKQLSEIHKYEQSIKRGSI